MRVGAAPPAQGSTHAPISAGETAERVPGTLRPDAEPPANTLRCTTEVPVLVNYLSFFDGNGAASRE